LENDIIKGDNPVSINLCEKIGVSVKWSLFFNESNSLRLEFKWASKQLLILNIELKTDRKQVVWTKAEKNFERRVKKNWNFDRLKITIY
jgi:hypothetical protein